MQRTLEGSTGCLCQRCGQRLSVEVNALSKRIVVRMDEGCIGKKRSNEESVMNMR